MELEKIKKIREETGAGMVEVKKALEEAEGDEEKARLILRKKGIEKAGKKSSRVTREGLIVSYVHSNGKVGCLLKLFCETDFVAKNAEFRELAMDLAMQVTAMNPEYINPEDVTSEIIDQEKEIWREQLLAEGKKEDILPRILEGKEKKFREEKALMTQPFVKNPDVTVGELIKEKVGIIGENIQVGGFYRMDI